MYIKMKLTNIDYALAIKIAEQLEADTKSKCTVHYGHDGTDPTCSEDTCPIMAFIATIDHCAYPNGLYDYMREYTREDSRED